jgi:hypothetical protein
MNFRCRNRARKALLYAFYIAFAAKTLIPVGYMPAALADGWPIRLCEAFPAGVLVSDHGAHHDHGEDDDDEGDQHWRHCPLGALASAAGIPSEYRIRLSSPGQDYLPPPLVSRPVAVRALGFRSRAPPFFS